MTDYYQILGVSSTAVPAEIRRAYMQLAKERHPDRFSDPTEKERAQSFFKDLTAAFNTLFNENSRREYDAERERPHPVGPVEMAKDAFERAAKMLEAGQHADAVTLLRTAVHHMPGEARYHHALGRALSRHSASMREAIQAMEKATQLSPSNAAFFVDLAALLHHQGLTRRAQKSVETALRLAPRDPRVQKIAGELGLHRS
ncbi:MAG TPA: DnaJ domain-containing protein [Vicinamibacteria bacterium]|jgi:curved DNA-binding protein CbpA|nr:DnaJ domain-containing protein [Vicinamibacteria bacterium]